MVESSVANTNCPRRILEPLRTPCFRVSPKHPGLKFMWFPAHNKCCTHPKNSHPIFFFTVYLYLKSVGCARAHRTALELREKGCRKFSRTSFTDKVRNAIVPLVPFFPVFLMY